MDEFGSEVGFMSGLLSSSDGTNQGLQIISMLAADHDMAPYVNIADSGTGAVGDIYKLIGERLAANLNKDWAAHKAQVVQWSENNRDDSDTDWVLNEAKTLRKVLDMYPLDTKPGRRMWRKIAKRLCMTLCYSGTAYGFGEMTFEDKSDHGCDVVASLSMLECILIGRVAYDTCKVEIKRGMELLGWLQDGIDKYQGGPLMSWRLPDGFLAFSTKEKTNNASVKCKIGNVRPQLKIYVGTGKTHKAGHKNACSPQTIHSIDAYILRQIVNEMPEDAQVSTAARLLQHLIWLH